MLKWADIFQINVNSYEDLVLQGTVSTELLQGHFEHIYLPNPITIIGDENVSFKLSSQFSQHFFTFSADCEVEVVH